MTLTDLLSMNPSDLDALAATKVMGWTTRLSVSHPSDIYAESGDPWWCENKAFLMPESSYHPTTNLNQAWELVEKVPEIAGNIWFANKHGDSKTCFTIQGIRLPFSEQIDSSDSGVQSLAHAITALAVAAVGGDQ